MSETNSLPKLVRTARWLKAKSAFHCKLPPLLFVTDENRTPDPVTMVEALPPEAGVIFRHYRHPHRTKLAYSLRQVCAKRNLVFLVAGDAALAKEVRADGLHLPQWQIEKLTAPLNVHRFPLVTAAAHDYLSLAQANRLGVSASLASPVFPTPSHPSRPHLGVLALARMTRTSTVPVYAMGGIASGNASRLLGTGIAGLAGIGMFAPSKL